MRKNLFIYLSSLFIAFIFSSLCSLALTNLLPEALVPDKAFYLDHFYNYFNVEQNKGNPVNAPILLVDINNKEMGSPRSMSKLLPKIYDMEPKAIGLDVVFSDDIEHNKADLITLKNALQYCSPKLVMAARVLSDTLQHSFCTQECGLDYGTVNGQSFYHFRTYDQVNDSIRVEKLIVRLAKKAGIAVDPPALETRIVNYTNLSFRKISSWENITPDRIKDQIVLLGDFKNNADIVNLPFKVYGKFTMPGILVNAYQLNAIVDPDSMFRTAPMSLSLFYNFIFLALLIFCFQRLSENAAVRENKPVKGGEFWRRVLLIFFAPFFLFYMFTSVIVFCSWYLLVTNNLISILVIVLADAIWLDSSRKLSHFLYYRIFQPRL